MSFTTEFIEDTLRPFDKAQGGEPVEPQAQGRLRELESGEGAVAIKTMIFTTGYTGFHRVNLHLE
jgi:hypothetical protein